MSVFPVCSGPERLLRPVDRRDRFDYLHRFHNHHRRSLVDFAGFVAVWPDMWAGVHPVAEQDAGFCACDLNGRHGCQFGSTDGGKRARGLMGHKLTDVVLELIFEAIDTLASAAPTTRAAIAIAVVRGAVGICLVAGLSLVRSMVSWAVFVLCLFAGHLVLPFVRWRSRRASAVPDAEWRHGTITG